MPPSHLPLCARITASRLLLYFCLVFHPHGPSSSRDARHEWCSFSCAADAPDQSQFLPSEIDLSPLSNPSTPPEQIIDAVQNLKSLLLANGCELLGQGDLRMVGSRPIDAGSFADVWAGEMKDGTTVAIKSYRRYSSLSCLPVYQRMCKEASICGRLNDNGKSFVSFIGVCSTPECPFGLVFTFMRHRNLKGYLGSDEGIVRLELLLEIARGLKHMHGLGIVHGNLKITNVLVGGDGHARIAGLGTASIQSTTPAFDVDRSFHATAPELINPWRLGPHDTGAAMASDVLAFAVLAWEVFAGRSPLNELNAIAGVHSIFNQPGRPVHPELSNRVWKTIKGCWRVNSTKRLKIADVVATLEAEVDTHKSK